MKIPKAEDVILNALAILSTVFMVSGLIRLMSNGSYALLLLVLGVALFVTFVIVVAALRRKRQAAESRPTNVARIRAKTLFSST